MAAELKLIFEGLDKVKKKIEEGFKTGIDITTKQKSDSKFGKSIEKLNKSINSYQSKLDKNATQQNFVEYQKKILEKSTKILQGKLNKNSVFIEKLTNNIKKLQGSIVSGASDEKNELVKNITKNQDALDAMKNKLEGLISKKANIESKPEFINAKTEKLLDKINIQIARTSNNILSMKNDIGKKILDLEQNDDVIKVNQSIEKKILGLNNKINIFSNKNIDIGNKLKNYAEKNNLYLDKIENLNKDYYNIEKDQISAMGELINIDKEMQNSFSKFDKILMGIYNKLGMNNAKENLISKRLGGGISSGGKSSKGAKGGMGLGSAAMMGGVVALMIKLVQSTKAIQFVMELVGGMLNMLIGPLIPILLTLLKPFLMIFLFLSQFLLKFFMNPGEALMDLVTAIVDGLKNIVGLGGKDKQKGAVGGAGAIAGGVIGAVVGGPIGAAIGATIGPSILNFFIDLFTKFLFIISGIGDKLGEWTAIVHNKIVDAWSSVKEWVGEIWTTIKDSFNSLGEKLSGIWDSLKTIFSDSWTSLTEWLSTLWEDLKTSFLTAWTLLSGFGDWLWESIKTAFGTTWDTIKNIGKWFGNKLIDALNDAIDLLNKVPGIEVSKIKHINDGVVSPAGKIVSVNPKDYLLASKNPRDLMGGGNSGNNITINLTVNGNADKRMIDDIVKQLRKAMSTKGAF